MPAAKGQVCAVHFGDARCTGHARQSLTLVASPAHVEMSFVRLDQSTSCVSIASYTGCRDLCRPTYCPYGVNLLSFDSLNHCLLRAVVLCDPDKVHVLFASSFWYDKSPKSTFDAQVSAVGALFSLPSLGGRVSLLNMVAVVEPLACYHDVDDTCAMLPKSG